MPTAMEKGKGKATAPVVVDSDSEGDDYFVVKSRSRAKAAPLPIRTEKSGSEEEVTEDEEDDEDGKAKKAKRKKRAPVRKAAVVPDWTIPGTQRIGRGPSFQRKRSSTEDRSSRDRADIVEVLSSDENSPKRPRKGKNNVSHLLEDLPPETEEEITARKARFHKTVSAISGPSAEVLTVDDSDDATRSSPIRSSPPPANREEVTIHVYMVADHGDIPEGASGNAIKHFEKKRTFTTFKYGKLDRVWQALATRISKDADEIVLTHNKVRIFSKAQTPASLGLSDGSDLKGYLLPHWNRMKDEERRELDWLLNPNARDSSPGADANTAAPVASPKPETKVKLCLRGSWGEVKLAVAASIPFDTLAKAYCMKRNKEDKFAPQITFSFDGDNIGRYTTVGELDIEDGDMIDVHVPQE